MKLLIKCIIVKINKIVNNIEIISDIVFNETEKTNLIDILNQYKMTVS